MIQNSLLRNQLSPTSVLPLLKKVLVFIDVFHQCYKYYTIFILTFANIYCLSKQFFLLTIILSFTKSNFWAFIKPIRCFYLAKTLFSVSDRWSLLCISEIFTASYKFTTSSFSWDCIFRMTYCNYYIDEMNKKWFQTTILYIFVLWWRIIEIYKIL